MTHMGRDPRSGGDGTLLCGVSLLAHPEVHVLRT